MQIAKRLGKIRPSMTLAMNAKAQEMRASGIEVLSLAVGEPDFPTPEYIKNAAKKALDENFTRYTPVAGIAELRKAAADYFQRFYKVKVPAANVIIGAGGKQCIYAFLETTINAGDEVLVPAPYWVSYPDMVMIVGAIPRFIKTSQKNNFKVTIQDLEASLTPKTRLLILNSPANPTGSVYTAEELDNIINWCHKNNVFILADEIYDQLVYEPCRMASVINWFHQYPGDIAVCNGLSKSFAMTGWRAGFLAAPENVIDKMTQLQSHSLSNISSITQKAALAALTGPDTEIKVMRDAFRKRRDLGISLIKSWERAELVSPDGAFYFFVNIEKYYNEKISDSLKLCEYILENAKVAAVPGAAFGDDGYIRLSYAVSSSVLEKALTAIGACLKSL